MYLFTKPGIDSDIHIRIYGCVCVRVVTTEPTGGNKLSMRTLCYKNETYYIQIACFISFSFLIKIVSSTQ